MTGLPLALAILLAASASGVMFDRRGCGCRGNPISQKLTVAELAQLRGYVQGQGVKHYQTLSDSSLQSIFRFSLISNFPDVVPASRSGVLQVITESLSSLTDKVVPSKRQVGQIADYLKKSVPSLGYGGVRIDLKSLVASTSVILHQRGVKISLAQLNILLKTGLESFLQSTAYQSSYSSLIQLIAALDHIDHNLPNILDQEELIVVRRALENRFNLDKEIFDKRYKLAIKAFEINRQRLLNSFHALAYRGPKYEVNIQLVIKQLINYLPQITAGAARTVLNTLQITNSLGGKGTPQDLLTLITYIKLDVSLRSITNAYANRILLHLPTYHKGLTISHIHEAYAVFIIGLTSQGVQPLRSEAAYEAFIQYTQQFFLGTKVYTVEAYFFYVMRVVVPLIPRGSKNFRLHIFENSVIVQNVLVPEPLTSIYKKGRKTIIADILGLQGSSKDITKRLKYGGGEKDYVENIVVLKPDIVAGNVPTYNQFEYQSTVLSAVQLQEVANVLVQRFNQLKKPSLQLPLLRILVRANVITQTGVRAAAAFRRLFQNLPAYSHPSNVEYIRIQLSEHRLQLTKTQLLAALQQFYVTSRCLGYQIPAQTAPSIFLYAVREYLPTLSSIPAQPFDYGFLEFLYLNLASIISRVTVVEQQVTIDDSVTKEIFSVFGDIDISIQARRAIIRFIHGSKLLPKSTYGVTVVAKYQNLLKNLFIRYPVNTYILTSYDLTYIKNTLANSGKTVDIKYLQDVNIISYIGLGLLQRFDASLTVPALRRIVLSSISHFLRTNKVVNLPSLEYLRILLVQQNVPTPQLPLPEQPLIQTPGYAPAPIYIVPGIELPVEKIEKLNDILRKRFAFVSLENVQSILVQTVLILRASGKTVTQNNCYGHLTSYYKKLPESVAIGAFDYGALVKKIDAHLVDATISGVGVQSALVELYIHMNYLKMPIPSVEVRDSFFSFVLGAYGKVQVRRQLPFGELFYDFLKDFLPNLPQYLDPFPIYSGPQVYSAFYSRLQTPIYASDIPLYLQVVRRTKKGSLTLDSLQSTLSAVSLLPNLEASELTGVLGFVKEKNIHVPQEQIIRAFAICRLSVGLSNIKLSRAQLIGIFQEAIYSTVQKKQSLLVVDYVDQIVKKITSYSKPAVTDTTYQGVVKETDYSDNLRSIKF